MKNEKKLRSARNKNDGFAHTVGSFHGVNMAAGKDFLRTPPALNTPPVGGNNLFSGAPSDRGQKGPSIQTESLAKWVSAVKPDSVQEVPPLEAEPPPHNVRTRTDRFCSVGSAGMISEAASRWDVESRLDNHGRHDSSAASCWEQRSCHVSDEESFVNDEDDKNNIYSAGAGHRRRERSRSGGNLSHNVWNGLGQTMALGQTDSGFGRTGHDFGLAYTDLGSNTELRDTASTTFFNDFAAPLYRPNDDFRVTHDDEEDNEDESYDDDREEHVNRNHARSPGTMTEAASVLPTPHSQSFRSRQSSCDTMGGHGEAMSRWDGSPPSSPAGAVTELIRCSKGRRPSCDVQMALLIYSRCCTITLFAFGHNHRLIVPLELHCVKRALAVLREGPS